MLSLSGVGNVVFFPKLFFEERRVVWHGKQRLFLQNLAMASMDHERHFASDTRGLSGFCDSFLTLDVIGSLSFSPICSP